MCNFGDDDREEQKPRKEVVFRRVGCNFRGVSVFGAYEVTRDLYKGGVHGMRRLGRRTDASGNKIASYETYTSMADFDSSYKGE